MSGETKGEEKKTLKQRRSKKAKTAVKGVGRSAVGRAEQASDNLS